MPVSLTSQSQAQVVLQLRALIWHSLDNNLLESALFTAERLHAFDPKSADSVHLLALCLLRDAQFRQAEVLTKSWLRHVGCAYIYAQCCLKLGGGKENLGINALEGCKRLWAISPGWNQHTDIDRKSLPDAAAIHCVIGKLWNALGDSKKSVDEYVAAVKLNPFLWEAFSGLCNTGVSLHINHIFKQSQDMTEYCKTMPGQSQTTVTAEEPTTRSRNATENHNQHDPFTSTGSGRDRADLSYNNHPSFFNRLNEGTSGVSHLETPTAQSSGSGSHDLGGANRVPDKPPPIRKTRAATSDIVTRKLASRSTRDNNADLKRLPAEASVPAAPARRSTRLNTLKFASKLGGSERETRLATKEREREQKKRAVSARYRTNLTAAAAVGKEKEKERGSSEDVNMSDAARPPPVLQAQAKLQVDKHREDAQLHLLEMYRKLGTGYFHLNRYHCPEALQALSSLPASQRETPRILCFMGRAYYEMANYAEAEKLFLKVRQLDPVRTADMEVFSTILWHQRKDVELSFLAHELIELDRSSPEPWCALGNCFSLQRDHDQALKCFKRATQLNPKLAYAFTLQGHEHVSNEEYEKALVSYRSAVAADNRHYNAWYGLGKVYEKMGKYQVADKHFRTAAKINPTNAILLCCVGMVLEKMKDYSGALMQYNSAVKMSPRSALSRYRKARTLMSLQNYEASLEELTILKDLAPDEANVHFLLGKLYKRLHNKAMAIKHLTIALNLDPKAGHLIKEVIENLDEEEDDHLAEDSEVYKLLDGDH